MSVNSTILVGLNDKWDFVVQKNQDRPFLNIDQQGRVTLPYQPFFNARLTEIVSNQTGAGRSAVLIANDVITDIGNNYNKSTGEFTAPVSGVYQLSCSIKVRGILDPMMHTFMSLQIGSYRYQGGSLKNPAPIKTYNNDESFHVSQAAYMLANEIAKCYLTITSGANNTVAFYGDTTNYVSSGFSGYLIA